MHSSRRYGQPDPRHISPTSGAIARIRLGLDIPGVFPGAQWPEPGEERMLKPLKLEDLADFLLERQGSSLSAKRRFPSRRLCPEGQADRARNRVVRDDAFVLHCVEDLQCGAERTHL